MANTTKTTKTTTSRFTVRKKIAAASLALGAGLIGTGFAAGVIDLGTGTTGGFGSGTAENLQQGTKAIDVTGQLTVTRPQTVTVDTDATGNPFTATQGEALTISGWENLQNAAGGTYTIMGKAGGDWVQVATGKVPTGGEINLPARISGSGTGERAIDAVAVSVEK